MVDLSSKNPFKTRLAPRRSRKIAEAVTGYVSKPERIRRAVFTGAVFGIFGGGIALLATGTHPKYGPWSVDGLVIALFLAVFGGVVGYMSKK